MLPEARPCFAWSRYPMATPCAALRRQGRMSLASDGARQLLLAMATAHRAAQT